MFIWKYNFFKDHSACINMIPWVWGSWGGGRRKSLLSAESLHIPSRQPWGCQEAICLKMSFIFPRSSIFFNSTEWRDGDNCSQEWREASESRELWARNAIYGAESAKVHSLAPHDCYTGKKFWAAVCGMPYAYCVFPGWENGLHLYCLAARKFSKSAGWCYLHLHEFHPQSTKQRAAFSSFSGVMN